jgi:hypothetical protein
VVPADEVMLVYFSKQPKGGEATMLKFVLRYIRYVLSLLLTIAFHGPGGTR